MRHSSPANSLSLIQRIALAGLLLCLALAQSLSFAHRALHHDVRMLAQAYEEVHPFAHQHGHPDVADADCVHGHGLFSRLFANHEQGDENCRLLDASSLFLDRNSPIALALPAQSAHVLVALHVGWLAAWHAPLFEPRAPPLLSL